MLTKSAFAAPPNPNVAGVKLCPGPDVARYVLSAVHRAPTRAASVTPTPDAFDRI
jgi:hypothetical protein